MWIYKEKMQTISLNWSAGKNKKVTYKLKLLIIITRDHNRIRLSKKKIALVNYLCTSNYNA